MEVNIVFFYFQFDKQVRTININQLIVRDEPCNHNTNRMAIDYNLMQLSYNLSIVSSRYWVPESIYDINSFYFEKSYGLIS